jgi:hypothetical protein
VALKTYRLLKISEVDARIVRFAAATGRFSGMHAVELSDGLLTIRQADANNPHL